MTLTSQDKIGFFERQKRMWREELDTMTSLFILGAFLFFIIFLIIPLGYIIIGAFIVRGELSLNLFNITFKNPFYFGFDPFDKSNGLEFDKVFYRDDEGNFNFYGPNWNTLFNTLFVAIMTTIFSTIIGVVFAYVMIRYEFPGKSILRVVILIPMLIPPFVSGIGIQKMIYDYNSVFNNIIYDLGFYRVIIGGLFAVILTQTFHFYTLIYLNAQSAFSNIDPNLEEQAENLGASHWRMLRTVTIPLATPGIAAGTILTAILSTEDLGTPIVFLPESQSLLAYQVYYKVQEAADQGYSPESLGPSMVLSILLLVISMVAFLAIRHYVGLREYTMISKGGTVNQKMFKAAKWQIALFYLMLFPILMIALSPHIGIIIYSLAATTLEGGWVGSRYLPSFTLDNWKFISENKDLSNAIINTMSVSFVAIIIVIIFGIMAAYVLARRRFPGKSLLDTIVTLPIAVPGVALGVGYFLLFYDLSSAEVFGMKLFTGLSPLSNPLFLLIFTFAVRRFPFTVRATYAGLQQMDETLEESSLNLGAGPLRTLRKITIPLIALYVFAGALISFVYSVAESSCSLMLIGEGGDKNATISTTIAMYVRQQSGAGAYEYSSALGVLLMIFQIIAIIVSNKILKERAGAITGI